jgi:malate dehydrogenase
MEFVMGRSKISVIGAGNVGGAVTREILCKGFADVVLLDVDEDKASGKALDLSHSLALSTHGCNVIGTGDWELTAGSDVVVVTSGVIRTSEMKRDELFDINAGIVSSVCADILKYSPKSIVIIVSNPLNATVAVASSVLRFPTSRVIGMAGVLDSARFAYYISQELNVCISDVNVTVLGDHGDCMLPLARYSSVGGIALTQLLDDDIIAQIVDSTRFCGGKLIELLGYSAYFAAAVSVCKMVESILMDQKKIVTCCAWCEHEYGLDGVFAGVPVVLGSSGVERVIELNLNSEEEQAFKLSVSHTMGILERFKDVEVKTASWDNFDD